MLVPTRAAPHRDVLQPLKKLSYLLSKGMENYSLTKNDYSNGEHELDTCSRDLDENYLYF